jgi:hypothetical protein
MTNVERQIVLAELDRISRLRTCNVLAGRGIPEVTIANRGGLRDHRRLHAWNGRY